jgi:hypothetical protein
MATKDELTLNQERQRVLGGSDIGSLYNLDWGCIRKLWYDKSGTKPDFPEKDIPEFERGHYLEPVVAKLYADKSGREVELAPRMVDRIFPYLVVHMDRIVRAPDRQIGNGYLEIKVVNFRTFKKFNTEGLHESYILQVQHGLGITNYSWGSYAILCPDPWQFKWFDVDMDLDIIERIRQSAKDFMGTIALPINPYDRLPMPDKRCFTCPWRHYCRKDELEAFNQAEVQDSDLLDMPELLPLAAERHELDGMLEDLQGMLTENTTKVKEAIEARATEVDGKRVYPIGAKGPGFKIIRIQPKGQKRWDSKALWALWDKSTPRLKELLGPYCNHGKEGKPPSASVRHYWTGDK